VKYKTHIILTSQHVGVPIQPANFNYDCIDNISIANYDNC